MTIACIVEGHGEVSALPVLLRRIAADINPEVAVDIPPPIRTPRSSLMTDAGLKRAVELAAEKSGPGGAILLLLDSDDDCPADLAPKLLQKLTSLRPDRRLAVVLPEREYEAWFIVASASLAERLSATLTAADIGGAHAIRDAKGRIRDCLKGKVYSETVDQASLSALIDLNLARRCSSFDKLWREMERLISLGADA